MDQTAPIIVIVASGLGLGVLAWAYIKRFQTAVLKHTLELEVREKELRKHLLELQVLRSLGERVGYSLDLRQILEVIINSLDSLVSFSTVSYMVLGHQGQIDFKVRLSQSVARKFLDDIKEKMLSDFSTRISRPLQPSLVNETVTGSSFDDGGEHSVRSFFTLPIIIGGQTVGLINISSAEKESYTDSETAILHTILDQISVQATKLVQVVENEKKRLSAMVSSFTDGILMVDSNLNIIVSNPVLPKLLGLSGNFGLYEVVAAIGTKAKLGGGIQQVLTSQTSIKLPEFELENIALQIDIEPVKDKFGYLLGAAVVFHDVTQMRQLEKLREEFTAMMVHELRTPLTTITYSTDMMLTDSDKMASSEINKNIEVIKSTAADMLSLVNELLDVAKIESGKFAVMKKDDDFKVLIEEKMKLFKPLAEKKHLQLSAEVEKDLPNFSFDRKRIGQALDNLLSNAIKYTDHGSVKVSAKSVSQEITVSITDTGDGINHEDLNKLFSKFDQLGKGRSGERSGTGLGLVVTKGIVETHGGKIGVSSDGLGKGTTFTFTLPIS